jgi:nitrate/nitrite-specific signal transduction histidine kinase
MERLKTGVGQAKEKLAELQNAIRQQRIAVLNGSSREELAGYLQHWEKLVGELQTDMMLEKSVQLNLLYEASHTINASPDWRHTLQSVLDAVILITEAERGMLILIDDNNSFRWN